MIRVLHIISGLGMGGAENMLWKLLANTPRSRVQSDVISLGAGDALRARIEATGARVFQIQAGGGIANLLRAPFQLMSTTRLLNPHLIQGWMNHGNVAAWLARWGCIGHPKMVWNIRQSLDRVGAEKPGTRLMIRAGALLSKRANALLFNSSAGLADHVEVGFRNRSMLVVPNGFNTEKFMPDAGLRAALRNKLGIDERTPVLGMVARYHPMKNHPLMLQAIARIRDYQPDVRAILVGTGVDSSNAALMDTIRELKLTRSCILLGECESTEQLYPAMDILCLPSNRAEGFPNVLGEAMACGVVCVAADVGDAGKIIEDTGQVVVPNDCDAFVAAIRRVLDLSLDEKKKMGDRARQRILNEYSIVRIADRYLDLYEQLLAA